MSGYLERGLWHPGWYDTKASAGRFVRHVAAFRGQVRGDGNGEFPAEAGRYHLDVSLACPWAHRVVLMRALKRLEPVVSLSVVEPVMGEEGWRFSAALPTIRLPKDLKARIAAAAKRAGSTLGGLPNRCSTNVLHCTSIPGDPECPRRPFACPRT